MIQNPLTRTNPFVSRALEYIINMSESFPSWSSEIRVELSDLIISLSFVELKDQLLDQVSDAMF